MSYPPTPPPPPRAEPKPAATDLVTARVQLIVPSVPNFLRLDLHSPEDGEAATVDIASVPDETLRRLGAVWTERLIEHAIRRRRGQARSDT